MAKGLFSSLDSVRRLRRVAPLALALVLFCSTLAWAKTNGHRGRAARQEESYGEKFHSPDWKTNEGGYKKRVLITQKRGKRRSSENNELSQRKGREYDRLSPEEKARMKRKFREWKSLPPEKQELLRRRMKRWKQLPPEDRSLYERRFEQWQRLSPEERERIRERLKKWNGLPQEEKETIRRRFRR
ncbi:MAG: DUF3106 domain-containing protein [Desulfobacteraceae bacterium]